MITRELSKERNVLIKTKKKNGVLQRSLFLDDEKDEALCDCDDADMSFPRDCTRQVDEKFPEFVPEALEVKTDVCILPCVWGENTTDTGRRQLIAKRRRYTFKSGGTCCRCATARHRLAADMIKKVRGRQRSLGESTPAEMAKEACNFAEVSQFAHVEAEATFNHVGDLLESMAAAGGIHR
jgi:hypothetical protein